MFSRNITPGGVAQLPPAAPPTPLTGQQQNPGVAFESAASPSAPAFSKVHSDIKKISENEHKDSAHHNQNVIVYDGSHRMCVKFVTHKNMFYPIVLLHNR